MAQIWGLTDAGWEAACNVGVYEWRPAKDRLIWSARLVRMFGPSEAPTGEPGFSRLVPPADRTRVDGERRRELADAPRLRAMTGRSPYIPTTGRRHGAMRRPAGQRIRQSIAF